jgi:putative MATE family efflux protein
VNPNIKKCTVSNAAQGNLKEVFTSNQPSVGLTTGNLWAGIWQLSWPMLVIMIFNFFVGFTDVYVAGFISPDVQAAVGFVGILYFFVIVIANAISIGTIALVSRAIGAGDFETGVKVGRQSLIFGFFVAIIVSTCGFAFYREIILLAGFPAQIRPIAETFLRIFAVAIGANYILIVSNALFRASGDVMRPMITMSIVSAVNILGDFGFVFGFGFFPKLGYPGIALSTALSVTVGMILNLVFFFFSRWRAVYLDAWTPSLETIRKISSLGWPAAMLQIAWNAGSIVLFNILGRLGDTGITALAAIANGLRIEAVIFLPVFALHMSASVLIGQNLGAGNPERAEQVGWRIATAGSAVISVMATAVFIWAGFFAAILAKDAAVLAETVRYLRINMISEPFLAIGLSLSGGLQGAGDTRGTMWIIIITMWFIRLPLAYFLSSILGFGASGVWAAMTASVIVQSLLMVYRFRAGKWKEIKI